MWDNLPQSPQFLIDFFRTKNTISNNSVQGVIGKKQIPKTWWSSFPRSSQFLKIITPSDSILNRNNFPAMATKPSPEFVAKKLEVQSRCIFGYALVSHAVHATSPSSALVPLHSAPFANRSEGTLGCKSSSCDGIRHYAIQLMRQSKLATTQPICAVCIFLLTSALFSAIR